MKITIASVCVSLSLLSGLALANAPIDCPQNLTVTCTGQVQSGQLTCHSNLANDPIWSNGNYNPNFSKPAVGTTQYQFKAAFYDGLTQLDTCAYTTTENSSAYMIQAKQLLLPLIKTGVSTHWVHHAANDNNGCGSVSNPPTQHSQDCPYKFAG